MENDVIKVSEPDISKEGDDIVFSFAVQNTQTKKNARIKAFLPQSEFLNAGASYEEEAKALIPEVKAAFRKLEQRLTK